MPECVIGSWMLEKANQINPNPSFQSVLKLPSDNLFAIEKSLENPQKEQDCNDVSMIAYAHLRGHVWQDNDQVIVKPCSDRGREVQHLAMTEEKSSIQIQGESSHSVIFIFDCSESMKELVPGSNNDSKFQVAQKVLRDIISGMNPNDQVGMIFFGHRKSFREDQGDKGLRVEWIKARPVANLAALNWSNDFEILNPLAPLGPEHRTSILTQIKEIRDSDNNLIELKPWGNTPGAGSISFACQHVKKLDIPVKIVMLTDGISQDVFNDPSNPKAGLNNILIDKIKNDLDSGLIKLDVVLFETDPNAFRGDNEADQLKQFKEIVENDWHSKLVLPDNPEKLKAEIQNSLKPNQYEIIDEVTGEVLHKRDLGEEVSGLSPGKYRIRLLLFDITIPLLLHPGQSAVWNVDWKNRQFRRSQLATFRSRYKQPAVRIPESANNPDGDTPIFLCCEKFQRDNQNAAFFQISLESINDERPILFPEEISFDIKGAGETPTGKITYLQKSRFPNPTWEIKVDNWGNKLPATFNAYWKMSRTPADYVIDTPSLLAAGEKNQFIPLAEGTDIEVLGLITKEFLEIHLRQANLDPLKPLDKCKYALDRFELGVASPNGDIIPKRNIQYSTEIFDGNNRIIVRFPLQAFTNIKDLKFAYTSFESLRKNALTNIKELEVRDFDAIGIGNQTK